MPGGKPLSPHMLDKSCARSAPSVLVAAVHDEMAFQKGSQTAVARNHPWPAVRLDSASLIDRGALPLFYCAVAVALHAAVQSCGKPHFVSARISAIARRVAGASFS